MLFRSGPPGVGKTTIARLLADRSILRELIHREHTGERLGFGAGGQTGWSNIMTAVGHEIAKLRRKLKKMDSSIMRKFILNDY